MGQLDIGHLFRHGGGRERVFFGSKAFRILEWHPFAAKIDRDVITKGAQMLNVELSELIADTIEGMKTVADQIGLGLKEA